MRRFSSHRAVVWGIFACALMLATLGPRPQAASVAVAATVPDTKPTFTPEQLLAAIRRQFRTHRPPPPFETYTMVRDQRTDYGYPDYVNSYTYHIWYRSYDHAALARKESKLGSHGDLQFKRPMFNVADDPGPPTADVFEPAPAHTLPPDFVPTPEVSASLPPVIATVRVQGEFDYRVSAVDYANGEVHLTLEPRRDPDRNRLREIWADAKTLELHKLVATDKLFVEGGPVYPVLFTIYFSTLEGVPIITKLHGIVGGGYDGDGQTVDFTYTDITFPQTLPDWYFNARDYAQNQDGAPL
jgi:hypothetical protein